MSNQAPNSIAERNEQQGTSSSNAVYYMGGCGGPFELDTDEADELLYEQYDEAILFTQTGHYAQMARPAAAELVEYGSQESLVYPMIKSTPTLHTISGFLNSSQDEFVEVKMSIELIYSLFICFIYYAIFPFRNLKKSPKVVKLVNH